MDSGGDSPQLPKPGFSDVSSGGTRCSLQSSRTATTVPLTPPSVQISQSDSELTDTWSHPKSSTKTLSRGRGKQIMDTISRIDPLELDAYVPRLLIQYLMGNQTITPSVDQKEGVCLFVDVCGFTRITEALRQSADGAESMAEHLNEFFALLLQIIDKHKGDVLQFSGDAVLVMWPVHARTDLRTECIRALHCSKELLAATSTTEIDIGGSMTRLAVHMSLGAGPFQFEITGGLHDSWRYVTYGSAVFQAVAISDLAKMDQLTISPQALEVLGPVCTTGEIAGHEARLYLGISPGLEIVSPPVSPLPDDSLTESLKLRVSSFLIDTVFHSWGRPGELRTVSSIFIRLIADISGNAMVQTAMIAIQSELAVRDGVLNKVLFDDKGFSVLCVFGLPGKAHEDDAQRSLIFAAGVSTRLENAGFSVALGISRSKVYCGHCGSNRRKEYTVIGDGVNIAARVMQHANAELLKRNNLDSSRGLGGVADKSSITIFVDEPTKNSVPGFRFGPAYEVTLKGKSLGSKIFELDSALLDRYRTSVAPSGISFTSSRSSFHQSPTHSDSHSSKTSRRHRALRNARATASDDDLIDDLADLTNDGKSIFGRDSEITSIKGVLSSVIHYLNKRIAADPSSRALLLSGDPAMGKSMLLKKAIEMANSEGVVVLYTHGTPLNKDFYLGGIVTLLAGLSRRSLSWLSEDVDEVNSELRPLLGILFPQLSIKDTDAVRRLSDAERTEALLDISCGLLKRAYEDSGILIVIDDAHWVDPTTFVFLTHFLRELPNLGVVAAYRQDEGRSTLFASGDDMNELSQDMDDEDSTESWGGRNAFVGGGPVRTLHLKALDFPSTSALYRQVLNCVWVEESVVRIVRNKSDGNPGFGVQIITALLSQSPSPLVIEDQRARFAPGVDVHHLNLPDGIEGIITSRVDRLPAMHQHYLKVASVVGPTFSLELVSKVLQLDEAGHEQFESVVKQLEQEGFLILAQSGKRHSAGNRKETGEGPIFAFKLSIMADVLYQMLLVRERRELHLAIAEEMETCCAPDLRGTTLLSLIRHFVNADSRHRAIIYLIRAAREALSKGKLDEALRMLDQVMEINRDVQERLRISEDQMLEWRVLKASVHYVMGDLQEAKIQATEVFAAYREPHSLTGCSVHVGRTRLKFAKWRQNRSKKPGTEDDPRKIRLVQMYAILALIAFHEDSASDLAVYALRGAVMANQVKDEDLHGRKGVLNVLNELLAIKASTTAVEVSNRIDNLTVLCGSDGEKTSTRRIATLLFLHGAWQKLAEQNIRESNQSPDVLCTLISHLHVAAHRVIYGNPDEANRKLLSVAKYSHNVQDQRTEIYALTISAFVDCSVLESQNIARSKMQHVSSIYSKTASKMAPDTMLRALVEAVHSYVLMSEKSSDALPHTKEAADILLKEGGVPSTMKVIALYAILEVLVSREVMAEMAKEGKQASHRALIEALLNQLTLLSQYFIVASVGARLMRCFLLVRDDKLKSCRVEVDRTIVDAQALHANLFLHKAKRLSSEVFQARNYAV